MKLLRLSLLWLLLIAAPHLYAADAKLSDLPAATAITADDLFLVTDDPGGTPVSKKVTATIVRHYATNGAISSGADANTTMVVNTTYLLDISGWAAGRSWARSRRSTADPGPRRPSPPSCRRPGSSPGR
jgi:hypothetical protein